MKRVKAFVLSSISLWKPEVVTGSHVDRRMFQIRDAMLDLLGEAGQRKHPLLTTRLKFSIAVETLWYARSELLQVLAREHGEFQAYKGISNLNELFRDLGFGADHKLIQRTRI
jgi:hypothetical protein